MRNDGKGLDVQRLVCRVERRHAKPQLEVYHYAANCKRRRGHYRAVSVCFIIVLVMDSELPNENRMIAPLIFMHSVIVGELVLFGGLVMMTIIGRFEPHLLSRIRGKDQLDFIPSTARI
jgi:hypothetical protein